MGKLTTCLWFDSEGEDAAQFYTSTFKNSAITDVTRYGEAGPREPGSAMLVRFELDGQPFVALNGGPADFSFNEALSFQIDCADQDEVDYFWQKLTEGGAEGNCGWLTDKYGVSWQVIPSALSDLVGGPDAEGAQRATTAMLQMKKLDVSTLQRAYNGI